MTSAMHAGPQFVTGTDEKYFYMYGILHESLRQHVPGFPLYVMDFGLSEGQRRILLADGILLARPGDLEAGLHPFRLKSSMDRYVGGRAGPWIWIDADMMAVRHCAAEVNAVCADLQRSGALLAMAQDMGPDRTLGSFSQRYETPNLRSVLRSHPGLDQAPYLNSGLAFFPDRALLPEWRSLAAEFEPDVLWEQNALNVVARRPGIPCLTLDARKWNVQASLLDELTFGADGIRCADTPACIVHATSSKKEHLAEFSFAARLDGAPTTGYARLFTRPELRDMQMALLAQFLQRHPALAAR